MASSSTDSHKLKNEDDNDGERSRPKRERNHGAFDEIAPSASTSVSTPLQKPCYDVFINHRGPDVKETLAGRIYNVLKDNNVTAFLDSKELELGDFLPTTLEATMRTASTHIAIFSKNYASSPWCLAELSFMLTTGANIIPVFYHVQPNDVRYVAQGKGIYVDAFVQHDMKGRYSPEKLQDWKTALHEASFYGGQIIQNNDDEKRFLEKIVNIALKARNIVSLVVADHPVGLEKIEDDFKSNTLQSSHGDRAAQVVGIWGMGGSGKTTLAKYLYNKRSPFMERSSFISDVRDGATRGMLQKQNRLLKDLGVTDVMVDDIEQGKGLLAKHLKSVKLLIVLDDVDDVDQLDALLPVKDSLREGSLIIITTREKEVLQSKGISSLHKMNALDPCDAKKLFCQHAFSRSVPLNGFEELVERFLEACNGLPLSLKIIGAQLNTDISQKYWESFLNKFSRILPDNIKEKLKISYDALDCEEKEMFLDTACFFIGGKKSLAIEVWNGSRWSGLYSWQKLFNKCLVELDNNECIKMHDHLRDLGREIANQQSPHRLWLPQQIIDAKKQGKKINGIRGIKAVPSNMITWDRGYSWTKGTRMSYPKMSSESLANSDKEFMANTIGRDLSLAPSLDGPKVLVTRRDYFNKAMAEISRELVWLRWFEIRQRSLPSWLSLKNLRVLEIYEEECRTHYLEELWEVDRDAPVQLRELVISRCYKFQRFPSSIGRLNMLKKIVVTDGRNLTSLPKEFSHLQSLEYLQLQGCSKLSLLPTSFGNLRNLRFLDLSSCKKLKRLPNSFKKLMLLQYLDLSFCKQLILGLEDFQNITELEYLNLAVCTQLKEFPHYITNQASLTQLYLCGEDRLRELPINIGELSRLLKLSIVCKYSTSLPASLGDLSSLTHLRIFKCSNLKSLPTSLGDLSSLTHLEIADCSKLETSPTSLGNLSSLIDLSIDCSKLESLPTSLGDLSSLTGLQICSCSNLQSLPISLGDLSSLKNLYIDSCPSLKCCPLPVKRLNLLQTLEIRCCPIKVDFGVALLPFGPSNLEYISLSHTEVCRISISGDCYPRLEDLHLSDNNHLREIDALPTTVKTMTVISCKMLRNIRATCDLVNLEHLKIKSCPELEELPSFARSTSLKEFKMKYCYQIQKIEGLECCTRLERLMTVENRSNVPVIESLEQMEKLRTVQLKANKRSAIERCIQTIKKWPDEEIQICTRAVPGASSLVDSLLSPNLVVDSISNRKILWRPKLKMHSSNGDELLMLCLIINSLTPKMKLRLDFSSDRRVFLPEVEEGRWAWVGVFKMDKTEIGNKDLSVYVKERNEEEENEEGELSEEESEEEENEEEELSEEESEEEELSEEDSEEELSEDESEEEELSEEDSEEELPEEESEEEELSEEESESSEEENEEEELSEEESEEDNQSELLRGLVVTGKKKRVMAAFHSLLPLFQKSENNCRGN